MNRNYWPLFFAVLALIVCSAAHAQQRQMTPVELQGAIAAALAQGEAARGMHIQAEAKAAALADENAKLKAEIEDLNRKAVTPPAKN